MKSPSCLVLLFSLFTGFAAAAAPIPPVDWARLDPALLASRDLIVGFDPAVKPEAVNAVAQAAGSQVRISFARIHAHAIPAPATLTLQEAARILLRQPGVRYVEPNYRRKALAIPDDPQFDQLYGMRRIRAPEAWDVSQGDTNIVVAVIDTGIDFTHPDLASNIWHNVGEDITGDGICTAADLDGLDNDNNMYVDDFHGHDFYADPDGSDGVQRPPQEGGTFHGTHVAGTIGAVGNNTLGVVGVNWRVKMMALRFLGPFGGDDIGGLAALNYALDKGARISNNSWGGGPPSQAFRDLLLQGAAQGHLFLAAAGNDGTNNDNIPHYPSNYDVDNVISVAAIDEQGQRATFSNYGLVSVDIGAPGVDILSTYPVVPQTPGDPPNYHTISGTSMACPHVAGAAAFLLGLNPGMPYLALRDAILNSSVPNPNLQGRTVTGGELDLRAAMDLIPSLVSLNQECYQPSSTGFVQVTDFSISPASNTVDVMLAHLNAAGVVLEEITLVANRVGTTDDFRAFFNLASDFAVPFANGHQLRASYVQQPQNRNNEVFARIDDVPPSLVFQGFEVLADDFAIFSVSTTEDSTLEVYASTQLPVITATNRLDGVLVTVTPTPDVPSVGQTTYVHRVTIRGLQPAELNFLGLRLLDCAMNATTLPSNPLSTTPSDYIRAPTRVRRLVFESGFEDGNAGFTTQQIGSTAVWQHGVPSYGPGEAASGALAWGTVLDGRYPNLENAMLISPPVAVRQFPRLEFDSWHKLSLNIITGIPPILLLDADFLQVEANDGTGWYNLTPRVDIFGLTYVQGEAPEWRRGTYRYESPFDPATMQVRFRLETDALAVDAGWYVDNFAISDTLYPGLNISDWRVSDAVGGDGDGFPEPGETITLDLKFYNSDLTNAIVNGRATLQALSSALQLVPPGGTVAVGNLDVGESRWVPSAVRVLVLPQATLGSTLFMTATMEADGRPFLTEQIPLRVDVYQTVAGRITDVDGGLPIAGATVEAVADNRPVLTTLSASDGTYALHGLVEGVEYAVRAYQTGVYSPSPERQLTAPLAGEDFVLGKAYANPTPNPLVLQVLMGAQAGMDVQLDNSAGTLAYNYSLRFEDGSGAEPEWLSAAAQGSVAAGTIGTLRVTGDATDLGPGLYLAELILAGNDIGGQPLVIPVQMIVIAAPVLEIANVAITGGDGDPYAEPGETVGLEITLVNRGVLTTVGLSGLLSYTGGDGKVVIVEDTDSWLFIPPSGNMVNNGDFAITIQASAADGDDLPFDLDLSDFIPGYDYSLHFTLPVRSRQSIYGNISELAGGAPVANALAYVGIGGSAGGGLSDPFGNYAIHGLRDGSYLVQVDPPAGFSRPVAVPVTIAGADQTGVDFELSQWSVTATPSPLAITVQEGQEGSAQVRVTNQGTVAGTVEFAVRTKPELPVDIIGQLQNLPPVDWANLDPATVVPGELLVYYRKDATRGQREHAASAAGVRLQHSYRMIPAGRVTVPQGASLRAAAEALARQPDVVRVEPNFVRKLFKSPDDFLYPDMHGLSNRRQTGGTLGADIGVEAFWETSTGSRDVVVGVVDSAISQDHPDLVNNLWINERETFGDGNFDGFPGIMGVDDDGDGQADFADPEVAELMRRIASNRIDNDGDFSIDDEIGGLHDDSPGVVGVDDDGDGVIDDYDGGRAKAIADDDENGYDDDVHGYDFADLDGNTSPDTGFFGPVEGMEHGTHVAGTIGAEGNNTFGVAGVNWQVSVMALKVGRAAIVGGLEVLVLDSAAILEALQYAVENGAHVSNHSYGGPAFSGIERAGIQAAAAADHLFVAAAGNDANDNDALPFYPCSYDVDNIISVAATDHDDLLASFSNHGASSVDIAAPGVDILSLLDDGQQLDYLTISGTSMASPHVAGAAALLKAVNPNAGYLMLKTALLRGSRPDVRLTSRLTSGGHLDLPGALRLLSPFWLKPAQDTATLGPSAFVDLDLLVNQGGHLLAGTYNAELVVRGDENDLVIPVTLHVNPAPAPLVASVRVDDAAQGDGDGYPEAGETVDLFVTLRNEGSGIFLSPVGTLSSSDAGVVVGVSSSSWPGLISGQSAESQSAFRITIGGAVSGQIGLNLSLSGTGSGPFARTVLLDIQPRHSIEGRVRDASTSAGLADVPVEFFGAAGGRVVTSADGSYRIDGLVAGNYRLRAIPSDHEKSAPSPVSVVSGVVHHDLPVGAPQSEFSAASLELIAAVGQSTTGRITIGNPSADALSVQLVEVGDRSVALISDGNGFPGLADRLAALGLRVSVYTNNMEILLNTTTFEAELSGRYSSDDALVFSHDLVIADLTGPEGGGRTVSLAEQAVFDQYLARGGHLLLTGANLLTRPDNEGISRILAANSLDRAPVVEGEVAAQDPQDSTLFLALQAGERLATTAQRQDLVLSGSADILFRADSGAEKITRQETPEGGVLYLWNGNPVGADWNGRGAWLDVLQNLVVSEFGEDIQWLVASPSSASVTADSLTVEVEASAARLNVGDYRAVLLFQGNFSGLDARSIPVSLSVRPLSLQARSVPGVRDWMDRLLSGDGGEQSAYFQLLHTGPDGVINPPQANGEPGGDDRLFSSLVSRMEFGRFGVGFPLNPDQGKFNLSFLHDLVATLPADIRQVYVRAWDAPSPESSVAYGESSVLPVSGTPGELLDFGTWLVNKSPNYPGHAAKDTNGDSVPDGYDIANGLDPRAAPAPLAADLLPLSSFGTFGAGAGQLKFPARVLVAGKWIVVLDRGNSRLQVYDRDTEAHVGTFGSGGTGDGQFSQPYGLAKHPSLDRLVVADTGNHRVQILSLNPATGALSYVAKFGSLGAGNGQMNGPRGVDFDAVGNVYVADTLNNRVQVFSSSYTFVRSMGAFGTLNGQFKSPQDVSVDANGVLTVADSDNHRMQVLNGSGSYLFQFGGQGNTLSRFERPGGIRKGMGGRYFVADTSNQRISIWTASRQAGAVLGSGGNQPGQFSLPQGLYAVPTNNIVYVADTFNHRIQRVRVNLDLDLDGMEDTWELAHGLDPDSAADAALDPDGDTLTNLGEYHVDTDPHLTDSDGDGISDRGELNRASDPAAGDFAPLHLTNSFLPNGDIGLSFVVEAGKTYRVEYATDLLAPVWNPVVAANNPVTAASNGVATVVDLDASLHPGRVYRVVEVTAP